MKRFLYTWLTCIISLGIIDSIWLKTMSDSFYKVYLGHLFTDKFNYQPAVIFYLMYSFGLTYLVIIPSLNLHVKTIEILIRGFVLGIITYAAYDLTNQATLNNWPIIVTVVDMFWGGILTSLASGLTLRYYYLYINNK